MLFILVFVAVVSVSEAALALAPAGVNVTAISGRPAILPCRVTSLQSNDVLLWTYFEQSVSTSVAQATGFGPVTYFGGYANIATINGSREAGQFNLVLRNVSAPSAGRYTCITGMYQINPCLLVLEAPQSLTMVYQSSSSPSLERVPVGVAVDVTCTSLHSRPAANIRWFRGSVALSSIATTTTETGGYYSVTSTLSRTFSDADFGYTLTCSAGLASVVDVTHVQVTLGAESISGSQALLVMLLLTCAALLHY